ncbi:MAG: DUF2505 family protein [Myxococcales bacterium]|nr:DUF2505 family protein [Myxococcales bacterium]
MTARFNSRQRFPVPVDALFEAHCDPAFQEAKALALGATTAKARRRDEGGSVVVEIDSSQPARWGGGEANAGTMTYRLDPAGLRGTWKRTQKGYEDRSRAEGTIVFRALGDGQSEVEVQGEIEIKIPLMGKMIEKKIVAAIDEQRAKEEATAADLLRQRAATKG